MWNRAGKGCNLGGAALRMHSGDHLLLFGWIAGSQASVGFKHIICEIFVSFFAARVDHQSFRPSDKSGAKFGVLFVIVGVGMRRDLAAIANLLPKIRIERSSAGRGRISDLVTKLGYHMGDIAIATVGTVGILAPVHVDMFANVRGVDVSAFGALLI